MSCFYIRTGIIVLGFTTASTHYTSTILKRRGQRLLLRLVLAAVWLLDELDENKSVVNQSTPGFASSGGLQTLL